MDTPHPEPPETHLSPEGLAKRWGCSLGCLANRRYLQRSPSFETIGGRVAYPLEAIRAAEAEGQIPKPRKSKKNPHGTSK